MKITQIKEFNSLEFYIQFHTDIPHKSGIYSWFFWPFKIDHIKDENFELFINKIKYFSSVNLNFSEESTTGYKFSVQVKERWFDNNMLGLSSKKEEILISHLSKSAENRSNFLNYLQLIIFSKPFYVGKADNLNLRLRQHFEGNNSEILRYLVERKICFKDVLICYEIFDVKYDVNINSVFEEITQRIVKPGLTKRPG
jgi:hypothetical protein